MKTRIDPMREVNCDDTVQRRAGACLHVTFIALLQGTLYGVTNIPLGAKAWTMGAIEEEGWSWRHTPHSLFRDHAIILGT